MSRHSIQHLSLSPTTKSGFVEIQNNDKLNPYSYSNLVFGLYGLASDLNSNIQVGLRVSQASFPNVFPTVTSRNNCLDIQIYNTRKIVYLPIGYYTASTICAELKALLLFEFSNLSNLDIACYISNITGKFSLLSNYPFIIFYNANQATMPFGMEINQTDYPIQAIETVTDYEYTGPRMCNMLGVTNLLITTNVFRTVNIDVTNGYGFLANIQVTNSVFGMIHYLNQSDNYFLFPDKTAIDQIDIQLKDQDGNLLDFQGFSWSIILEFKYMALDVPRQTIHQFVNQLTASSDQQAQSKIQTNKNANTNSQERDNQVDDDDDQQDDDNEMTDDPTQPDDTEQADTELSANNEYIMENAYQNIYPAEL